MEDLNIKSVEDYLLVPDLAMELIKNLPYGVIAVNNKGEIILVNPKAALMFGYHKSELTGKKIETLVPDAVKDVHENNRHRYIDDPRLRPMGVNMELKAKRKDGSEIEVDINLIPVQTVNGLITMAVINRK
jgi:PAS domain S-box-containing protein